jgi:hypothetical protein
MVRITLGAMSTLQDVEKFVAFFEQHIVDCSRSLTLDSVDPDQQARRSTQSADEKIKPRRGVRPPSYGRLIKRLWTRVTSCLAIDRRSRRARSRSRI